MIKTIALLSTMALAMPALAADQPAASEDVGEERLGSFWSEVFPLPGESYGMFADPYGSPHDPETIRSAWQEVETGQATAEAAEPEDDEQVAATPEIDPLVEGPDLRDATGQAE